MEIIHIVLGKANPQRMNGVNKVVYQLASNQSAQGRNVQVWGFSENDDKNYGDRNFRTQIFKAGRNPFSVISTFEEKVKSCSENTCFHLHGGWIPRFYSVAKILTKNNRSYILTPHGAYNKIAMQKNAFVKKVYFNMYEKQLIKNADYIHCIGQSEVDGLNELFPAQRSFLQAYGFDIPTTPKIQNQKNSFVFGFLGRIDIYTKGLDLLVKAFAQKFKGMQDVSLWIIGDSEQRAKLEEMVKELGINNQVVFTGAKFGADKDELLKQINVFLHPSRNEGLPSAVLEAASFGVPSIVSKATNVGEYIEQYKAGKCVPNENVNELSEAMFHTYILDQKEYENLSKNTSQMLKSTFSWSHVVNRFDRMYQHVTII